MRLAQLQTHKLVRSQQRQSCIRIGASSHVNDGGPIVPKGCIHCCREMLVQWTMLDAAHPEAKWGIKSGEYTHKTAADTDTYTREVSLQAQWSSRDMRVSGKLGAGPQLKGTYLDTVSL